MNQLHLEKLLGLILTVIGATILVIDGVMIIGYQSGFEEAVYSAPIIAPIIVFGSLMTVLGLILLWLNTPELPDWMAIPLSLIYAIFGVILLGIGVFGIIRVGEDLIYHPEFANIIACGASVFGFGIILFLLSPTKLLNWKDNRDEIYFLSEIDKAHASRVYDIRYGSIKMNELSKESERKYWIYTIVSLAFPILLTIFTYWSSSEYFWMGVIAIWGFWSAIPFGVIIWSRESILRKRRTREE